MPHPRQRPSEAHDAPVLLLLLPPRERLVVAVLPPPRAVLPNGLQLRLRGRCNGHVRPGRRDLQRLDPGALLLRDRAPVSSHVAETPLGAAEPSDSLLLQVLDLGHGRTGW